ncbi:hypothetical protein MMC18_001113 [Xylographa bjoerkii]|nr:hypothetical protein [Xylographa bjoerkii]
MASQVLRLPFILRGTEGHVDVTVEPNSDPHFWGMHLLFSNVPMSYFLGYPVCQATISYHKQGYAAVCGWIQLVKSTDGKAPNEYEMDIAPVYRGLQTPFIYLGYKPELFDAPGRLERNENDWMAQSFLCYMEDAAMTRNVKPVCAFQWGFDSTMEGISLKKIEALPLKAWDAHIPLLQEKYTEWNFHGSSRSS